MPREDRGKHDRLRDWEVPCYTEEGRYKTLGKGEGIAHKDHEIPKNHGDGMRRGETEGKRSSADPGRRNK
jgi:hypothetical protein